MKMRVSNLAKAHAQELVHLLMRVRVEFLVIRRKSYHLPAEYHGHGVESCREVPIDRAADRVNTIAGAQHRQWL